LKDLIHFETVAANTRSSHLNPGMTGWAEELLQRFSASTAWVSLFFTILYIPAILPSATAKLLWDDEFFTLYLSTTSGWGDLINALRTGADIATLDANDEARGE